MKFYIHQDGFIYSGDMTAGAREATQAEIDVHLAPQIINPVVDEEKADMWEAILALSAELEKLEGGI